MNKYGPPGAAALTEFVHEPYRIVHVRDVLKLSLDDLISMISALEPVSAYWCDGVLFAVFAVAESDELAKKEIAGETYVDRIVFAKHPEFSRTVKSSTNVEIGVVNVSGSGTYSSMVAWLKGQPAWA